MFYYFVWVRSKYYHGKEPLTYSSEIRLSPGSLVEIELQKAKITGFISGLTTKPRFRVKPIISVLPLPTLPLASLKLLEWIKDYYPAPLGLITQQVLPPKLNLKQNNSADLSFKKLDTTKLPPLNQEQQQAYDTMSSKTETYILHGRTGSGKTRLYIEMALKAVASKQSVVILTPEISLTPQLLNSFREVFGDRVIGIHSKQTPKERRIAWLNCLLAKEPLVIIGPRSALFVPLNNIGLIVVDEAHENAYKQNSLPHYQTTRVASTLAKLNHATLILGSATPLIADYYIALMRHKPIIRLEHIAKTNRHASSDTLVIDKKDVSQFNNSPFLSQSLIESISLNLSQGNQTLLYLNRRGTARVIMCENCGWQAECPHCGLPLTYHGDVHAIRCHSCNFKTNAPVSCPSCHSPNIIFKTAGTKAIATEVERLFPEARISRFDTDNTKNESFEHNYEDARLGRIDILIGTQLLAKGLDLPSLGLVGVILADTSLYIPDFSSDERTFQLINQVIGRVGRGHIKGKAIIQTYHPELPVIKFALNNDYDGFYKHELKSRQTYLFPPFCFLLKLTVRRASSHHAEIAAEKLKQQIGLSGIKVLVEGPAPSFYERSNGQYEWQLIVKAKTRKNLLQIVELLPANWQYDLDPINLL